MKRLLLASSALASCLFSVSAQAQSVWGGTGSTTTTADYNFGTNWSTPPAGAPPVNAGQAASFGATGSSTVTVSVGPITPDSWTFSATTQSYTISGQAVNFNGAGPNLVNNANSGQSISISNNMTGAGISQAGSSTLTLSGTNAFTTTSITAGRLVNSGSLTSTVTSSGTYTNSGTLTGDVTNSGAFGNGGTVNGSLSQSGIFSNTANSGTMTGTVSLTDGTFINQSGGQVQGATTNNGGTVYNVATMAGVTNTSGSFFNNSGGSITTLTNNGGDFANASGATVSGAATISAGSVTNAGTFASTLGLAGGTFANNTGGQVQGATTNNGGTVDNNAAMAGVINSSGTFNNNSGGSITTLTNNGGTFNNDTGATVSGAATLSSSFVNNSGTFSSTVGLTGGTFTNNTGGQVQGALTNNGGTVDNYATMAGVTNSSGTFRNNNGGSITTVINNGGIFNNNTGGSVTTLTNNGGFSINASTITGAATISGGILFVTGGGTVGGAVSLTNAAGTFDIAGATTGVSVGGLSGVGASTVNLGAKTLTISGGLQTFAGVIQGSGNLVVSSGAQEALTGTSTYTGMTTINGGTLVIDGSIATSSMTTVNSGLLHGVGTVGNLTVNAGGGFAPGLGTVGGSMTVAGSLVMAAASTYFVDVTPAISTSAVVTGNANLGGATVAASFAAGSYVAKQYTVLTAGSITGAFAPTASTFGLPAGFSTSVSYDATLTHAYLNLFLSFAPPSGSLNGNQQNVGNAVINFFNTTGGIPMAFGGLTPSGLTQLSGEVGSAPQQSTFNAMTQFIGVMTDPFVAGRGDPVSAGGAPNAYVEDSMAYAATGKGRSANARDAFAAYTKAPVAPSFEQRWSVWAAGFGGSQQTDGNNAVGSNTTTSSLYGTAVGADYRVSRDTLIGFALAGGGTNFSVANNLGGGRSDLFQAGAFFRHNAGPAYITGALAYGWQDITTDRTVTVAGVDRLRAEFNANAWSGRVEGGYRFVSQGIGLTPYAAAQVTAFDLPAYAEQAISGSNQFALAYSAKNVTDTRSELGLRTDKAFAQTDGIVTLRGRVAWAHDFNSNRSIGATFQTLPGASFVVNGAAMASEAALVTASAEKKWLNGWAAAATFEGEFSNVTRSYAGKGVVRYAW